MRRATDRAWPSQAAGAVRDVRGGMRLLLDGVRHGIDRLEQAHQRVAEVDPPVRGIRLGRPGSGIGALVYRGLRGTADLAGGALDLGLASLQASLLDPYRQAEPGAPEPTREAVVAALNALVGDHLQRTDNPLAIRLQLRTEDATLPAQPRVLVLVHDLALNDLSWRRHGRELASALGCTPLYVHYNTGQAVPATGHELAAELEVALRHWRAPLESLMLAGHGLGGLVLRSALHQAQRAGLAWATHVRKVVFLGTPHRGASPGVDPLAKLGATSARILAPIARLSRRRSAGVRDFLDGRVLQDDARTGGPAAGNAIAGVPPAMPTYAIAGAVGDGQDDGLVPVASALGRDAVASRDLLLPEEHRWVIHGVDHASLLASEAVCQKVRQWLAS